MHKTVAFIPLLFALGVAPALARPTVIAELGSAPLLGTSRSTAEMRERVDRNAGMVSAAAARLGLSQSEYAEFRSDIDHSHVAWVTVPRHLDAMSWASGKNVYAIHDVQIPAGTNGWEVDLHRNGQIIALYMPAKCGNLSVVRRPAPIVAHRPTRVAALKVTPPPAVVVPPVEAPAPVPPPAEVPNDTPAPPATVAAAEFPPAPVAAHHALFLAPLLFGLAALSGGSGTGPIATVPVGCP